MTNFQPNAMFSTREDKARFLAATELLRSTGSVGLEIRHSPEEEPPIIWSVVISWYLDRAGRPISQADAEKRSPLKPPVPKFDVASSMISPLQAMHRLTAEVIDSGRCAVCLRHTVVDWTGTELAGASLTELGPDGVDDDPICFTVWTPRVAAFIRACDGRTYAASSPV